MTGRLHHRQTHLSRRKTRNCVSFDIGGRDFRSRIFDIGINLKPLVRVATLSKNFPTPGSESNSARFYRPDALCRNDRSGTLTHASRCLRNERKHRAAKPSPGGRGDNREAPRRVRDGNTSRNKLDQIFSTAAPFISSCLSIVSARFASARPKAIVLVRIGISPAIFRNSWPSARVLAVTLRISRSWNSSS